MIMHINGDLLEIQNRFNLDVICHQVNCMGVMGAGIASQIKNKYPEVYISYQTMCKDFDEREELMGQIQMVKIDNGKKVCNFFSQYGYGRDGKRYTSYDAFWNCLHLLKQEIPVGSSIGLPLYMGCGYGGADWTVIEAMIRAVLDKDYYIYIVRFNK